MKDPITQMKGTTMFRFVPMLFIPFVLAGCLATASEGPNPISEATASAQFKSFCRGIPLAKAAFDIVNTRKPFDEDITAAVRAAYNTGVRTCNNPPQDIYQALEAATAAYDEIMATQDAKL